MMCLLFSLFLLVAMVLPVQAANCPVGGTTIFYGNGVNTTWIKAVQSANLLQDAIYFRLAQYHSVDPSCIVMKLAYDPAVSQNDSIAAHIINIGVQVGLISSVQVANQ